MVRRHSKKLLLLGVAAYCAVKAVVKWGEGLDSPGVSGHFPGEPEAYMRSGGLSAMA